jgi:serine/threonine protein phosphatase PrpC
MFSWIRKLADQLAEENAIKQGNDAEPANLTVAPAEPQLSEEEKSQIRIQEAKLMRDTAERVLKALRNGGEAKFQSNFQVDSVLQLVKKEDGVPLAKEFEVMDKGEKVRIKVNSVTDGVGGTGCSQRYVQEYDDYLTEAHLGANEIQRILEYYLENHQSFFLQSAEQMKIQLDERLKGILQDLDRRYPLRIEKHTTPHYFQTTFSMGIIQERTNSKSVQMLWAGDSPIIIITPEDIMTNTNCDKSLDTPLSNCLSNRYVNLNQHTLITRPDKPMVMIACSDGMVKFRGVDSQVRTLVSGVLHSLRNSKTREEFSEKIYSFFSDMPKWEDDTTISISTSVKNSGELEKLMSGQQRIIPFGD